MTSLAPADGLTGTHKPVTIGGAASVPAEPWNRLARRGFHLHGWFTGAERAGWTPRHVGVGDGSDGLMAVIPAWLVGAGTAHDLHDRWLGPLRGIAAAAGLGLRPILSVQSPLAQCSDPLVARGAALSVAVLHRVFAALEGAAVADRAVAVAWPWVELSQTELIAVARERGYAVCSAGCAARLRVEWPTFEDYVASRSKNVRRTVRADMRALAAAGVRTADDGDFTAASAAMDALYGEAFRRRNGRPAPGPGDLLARLAAEPYPSRAAQLAWDGSRLVGMSLNLWTPELMDGTFAAFSADHGGGPVYYHDLCYAPVRRACREGIAAIELGASALHAKVLRGARLHRRVTLIRGTSPARHRALALLGALVAKRVGAKERRALGRLWGPGAFAADGAA